MYAQLRHKIKELNQLAFPLIIQNIAGMLIGLLDEMFVGRISTEAYGVIGIVVSLTNLFAGILGYFAVALNIEGARRRGEKDEDGFRTILMTSILMDLAIGISYGGSILIFCRPVFSKIYGLDGEALNAAITYARITSLYMLFQLLSFTFSSYFKIMKRTGKLMWVTTGATLINVVIDYILVFGKFGFPKLGVAGAALGTMIGMFLNAFTLFILARKDVEFSRHKVKQYMLSAKELVIHSLPLAGEELLEGSVFVVLLNAVISQMGSEEIGAYLLVKTLLDIVMVSMYMYGSAELTVVSERIGQKKYGEIKELAKIGVAMSCLIYMGLSVLLLLFKDTVPKLITDEEILIANSAGIILPMIVMNLCNPVQVIYKYVLQACNKAKFVLYATAAVNLFVFVLILLLRANHLQMSAVFIGMFLNYFILMFVYYACLHKTVAVVK